MITKVVTIKSTQTVFDIALQTEGTVENVVDFMSRNGIDSLDSDITGKEISYEITRDYIQTYYIANQTTVATRPTKYLNTIEPCLLQDNGFYLFQQDGYKILL